MLSVIEALLPVFGIVIIGFIFKRNRFPGENFWPQADKLTYFVLFPALIIEKLSNAQLQRPDIIPMVLILIFVILVVSMTVSIIMFLLKEDAMFFTSVIQGSIRPNTYVGLAAAVAVYGQEGLAIAAVAISGVIPLVNIISVFAFVRMIPNGGKTNAKAVLINILKNPLIIACIIGLLLNFTRLGLPYTTRSVFEIIGRAALPMGLMSVGAGLILHELATILKAIVLSSVFKLLILPLSVMFIFDFFEIDGLTKWVAVMYASLPCSVSSYTLASQMGGDTEMVAGIITVQTLIAMVSMTLILSFSGI